MNLWYTNIVGDNMLEDNFKLDEMEPGEQELDMLTAVDFNLEDTMEVPIINGDENV